MCFLKPMKCLVTTCFLIIELDKDNNILQNENDDTVGHAQKNTQKSPAAALEISQKVPILLQDKNEYRFAQDDTVASLSWPDMGELIFLIIILHSLLLQ